MDDLIYLCYLIGDLINYPKDDDKPRTDIEKYNDIYEKDMRKIFFGYFIISMFDDIKIDI